MREGRNRIVHHNQVKRFYKAITVEANKFERKLLDQKEFEPNLENMQEFEMTPAAEPQLTGIPKTQNLEKNYQDKADKNKLQPDNLGDNPATSESGERNDEGKVGVRRSTRVKEGRTNYDASTGETSIPIEKLLVFNTSHRKHIRCLLNHTKKHQKKFLKQFKMLNAIRENHPGAQIGFLDRHGNPLHHIEASYRYVEEMGAAREPLRIIIDATARPKDGLRRASERVGQILKAYARGLPRNCETAIRGIQTPSNSLNPNREDVFTIYIESDQRAADSSHFEGNCHQASEIGRAHV
jgi:hypothetical protein